MSGPTLADEGEGGLAVTTALGVDTVAVFRGIRARRLNPSVYATLDLELDIFYAGAFTSPVGFASETVPLVYGYGGVAPTLYGVDFNFGASYYAFPGSRDVEFDLDGDMIVDHSGKKGLFEVFAGAARDFRIAELKLIAFHSPDTFGETGEAWYFAGELSVPLPYEFKLAARYGASEYADARFNDDYADYSVALKRSAFGFDFGLTYSNVADLVGADEEAFVFGIRREFGIAGPEFQRARRERKLRNNWVIDKALLGIRR